MMKNKNLGYIPRPGDCETQRSIQAFSTRTETELYCSSSIR